MNWFKILEGSRRSPSGLEWRIWRKLPSIAFYGTVISAVVWAVPSWILAQQADAVQPLWLSTLGFIALGAVVFHWTMVLTLAIGCVIVMVMKGPAYVADAYPLSHRDHPAP